MRHFLVTDDIATTAGPSHVHAQVGMLKGGAVVRLDVSVRSAHHWDDGWSKIHSDDPTRPAEWVPNTHLRYVADNFDRFAKWQRHRMKSRPEIPAPPRRVLEPGGVVDWVWGPRMAGSLQVAGGLMEICLGVGGVMVPEPATTVGGVIVIAHGSDTLVAGVLTIWDGKRVVNTLTQQGSAAAARGLGADADTSEWVGHGVDFVAGLGPSMALGASRRVAIGGLQATAGESPVVVAGYMHKSAFRTGHNLAGVRTAGREVWFDFAGLPISDTTLVAAQRGGTNVDEIFELTPFVVSRSQAARAIKMSRTIRGEGPQVWSYLGPNCTTTSLRVLRAGGVVMPAWSVTRALVHIGARAGPEITFMTATAGKVAPLVIEDPDGAPSPYASPPRIRIRDL